MKLLFDNNLSVLLPAAVAPWFPDSSHVAELALEQDSDHSTWQYAKKNDFVIVTKDRDFYYLSELAGAPPKVIWLTIGNCTNKQMIALVVNNAATIATFLTDSSSLLLLS